MNAADSLDRGRRSFDRHAWAEAHAHLSAADQDAPLGAADLERLAMAASMLGRDDESDDAGARAFQECLRSGDVQRAARCAFWLGFGLLYRGEMSRGGGWLARARGLLEEGRAGLRRARLSSPAGCEAEPGRGRRRGGVRRVQPTPPRSETASTTRI